MDPVGDLALLASSDPRVRFAAEDRLRAAGAIALEALGRLAASGPAPEALRARARDLRGTLRGERARRAFEAAVPDAAAPDLWRGAVAIAAEADEDLRPDDADRRLDALAEGAERAVRGAGTTAERVARLTAHLFEDEGFHGDDLRYDDPRNSYLPCVLERRVGLPVALSVLWIAVGRRIGLEASGVGLPLHFVARCEDDPEPLFVDSFHGTVLDANGCRRLVAERAGREVAIPDRWLLPLRPTEVLQRMLRNLRAVHEGSGDLHGALSALDRILHLTPLAPERWRERAVLLARLCRPTAAARALSRALALDPAAHDRTAVEACRRTLLREAAARN